MGKSKSRTKIKKLNQIIVQQQELIKTNKSMDSVITQISPQGGWHNPENNFGPNTDQNFNTVYLPPYEFTYQELTNLFQNPLIRAAVLYYMDDATREGFELTDKDDNEKASDMKKEMDTRFNWISHARKMIGIEKVYGGGVIFADVEDGREPHDPLNENNVRKVNSFQTVERYFAHPFTGKELRGVENPGQPQHYKISLAGFRNAETFDCHESRLIRYPSYETDNVLSQRQRQRRITWDVSLIQIMYDTIKKYSIAQQASSALVQGFVMDVLKFSNLNNMKDLAGLQEYVRNQWSLRNSMNANVLGADDSIERLATPTTGMEEITKALRMDVGMATGIPVSILFSEESGALGGSTLSESQKVWYSKVSASQKNKDTQMYRGMLKFVALEQGWDIENIEFNYNEIEYRSAQEQADLEKTDAETASIFVNEIDLPSKGVLDAKLTGGKQKIGALDYDPDAFEKELETVEEMEALHEEMDLSIKENQVKNTDPDRQDLKDDKQDNLKDAGQSKDEYNVVFEV
jgi:phage-related protein (TIGR01555 family)